MIIFICVVNELVHWTHRDIHMCTHNLQSKTSFSCNSFPVRQSRRCVWLALEHQQDQELEHQSSRSALLWAWPNELVLRKSSSSQTSPALSPRLCTCSFEGSPLGLVAAGTAGGCRFVLSLGSRWTEVWSLWRKQVCDGERAQSAFRRNVQRKAAWMAQMLRLPSFLNITSVFWWLQCLLLLFPLGFFFFRLLFSVVLCNFP